ncbi:MAG: hypothetical protein KGI04_01715 [Candidatus Micrarchaeota archaeon]|nr:hypothetical protein [Candidatus Micrarchaeota archaeon]
MGKLGAVLAIAALLAMANGVFAYGYGTSSISLGSYSRSMMNGNSTSVSYTVNLASGSTWGTTLSVVNNNQLASHGIMVSLSNPSGDPPYSGTMSISASSTTPAGTYNVTLAATGDDPSTSNSNFVLTVLAPTTTAQTTTVGSANQTTTAQQTTSVASTSIQPSSTIAYNSTGAYYSNGNSTAQLASSVLIVLIILGALYGLFAWKSALTRLVVIGTALILIGTVAWLYGDYSGGIQSYIWGGVAAIAVGTLMWIYGDAKGGTFKQKGASGAVYLGIALIVIGLLGWVYGEVGAPGVSEYWWGGTVLLVVGTVIWLYGDAKAGAFLRRK